MNKNMFMNELAKNLLDISELERNDILLDYEEHFSIGIESGRSEEEIAKALGEPQILAKQIKEDYSTKSIIKYSDSSNTYLNRDNNYNQYNNQYNNSYENNSYDNFHDNNSYRESSSFISKVLIGCVLFFLNTIVLPLFLGLGGGILGLFGGSIGLLFGGLMTSISPTLHSLLPTFVSVGGLSYITCVFLGITLTGLGLLSIIGCVYLTKGFIKLIIKYLQWNLNILRRGL